jgi:cytoskeletal protein CcmA (bactofilin family)
MKPPDPNTPITDEGISLEGNSPVVQPSASITEDAGQPVVQPPSGTPAEKPPQDKPKLFTRIAGSLRHANVYLLSFFLIMCIAVVVAVVAITKNTKNSSNGGAAVQTLTTKQLQKLASSAPTIGTANQTLNIAANTILSGNVLARQDLDVAGTLTAGNLHLSQISVAGISASGQDSTQKLSVNGTSTITGAESISGILSVAGSSSFGGILSANQIAVQNLQLSGNFTLSKHILVTGSSPTQLIGPAVGSGGTASDSGTDTAGSININTGSNPPANSCFITLTFTQAFASTPYVVVTPVGASAGGLQYYVTRSTTSMSLCINSAAPANASFSFDYVIFG